MKPDNEKARQTSISMNTKQAQRLYELAQGLKMPKSKVVNILVLLAANTQVLQDLIKKIDKLPAEWKDMETNKILKVVEEKLERYWPIVEEKIEEELKTDRWIESLSKEEIRKIITTKWLDKD